jgi:hypothetical protein
MANRLVLYMLTVVLLLAVLPLSAQSTGNRATLVIVDSRDPVPWDYRVRFYDETGTEVATMKRCQVVRLSLTPGPHKFRSNKDKKKVININAIADETYYAAGGIKNATLPQSMRFDFDIITRKEAESWVSKCNLPASSLEDATPKTE